MGCVVTVRVTVVVCTSVPLVAVIVKVEFPTGVEEEVETVSVLVPDPVSEVGLNTPVEFAGSPLTVKPTVPVKPFNGVRVVL
jgi:hypothetical protein